MFTRIAILLAIVIVVALPFLFRRPGEEGAWAPDDPVLVIVSPHNEAIRHEFGRAFAEWHRTHFGKPVRVEWRAIGGTSEITRYLEAEFTAAFRAWWTAAGRAWPAGGGETILDRRFNPDQPPASGGDAAWERKRDLYCAFRGTDDPAAFSCKIDLLFGGGTYDHDRVGREGLAVPAWPPGQPPPDTLTDVAGRTLIPVSLGGEIWRTDTYCGTVLSTFGICYNRDRLADLGVTNPPRAWVDLTAPALLGQVAMADPSKSGSIAKAYEMIVQQQCWEAVRAAGFTDEDVATFETQIAAAKLAPGEMPPGVPRAYQQAVEAGWLRGVRLVQRIGANARYLTDSGGKVAIDVSVGDAAAGIGIDFFGRYQAEMSRAPDGAERMVYVTPRGGSSVSADPISLLRGAEHRELAQRFIAFVLSADGQRLWNYRPGTPGGPRKYALRRLPIRRDFYPDERESPSPNGRGDRVAAPGPRSPGPSRTLHDSAPDGAREPLDAPSVYAQQRAFYTDDLGNPDINPYELGGAFVYQPRWTGAHFNMLRDLVRVMCLDAGDELRAAWRAVLAAGGPARQPAAMALLERLPDAPAPFSWASALSIPKNYNRIDYMREWTVFFRRSYGEAREEVERSKSQKVEM